MGIKIDAACGRTLTRFISKATNVSVIDQTVVTRAAHLTHSILLS